VRGQRNGVQALVIAPQGLYRCQVCSLGHFSSVRARRLPTCDLCNVPLKLDLASYCKPLGTLRRSPAWLCRDIVQSPPDCKGAPR
jgi:hypothetical protein